MIIFLGRINCVVGVGLETEAAAPRRPLLKSRNSHFGPFFISYFQFRSISGELYRQDLQIQILKSFLVLVLTTESMQGKVGRWTRAYHLKVPPPPMPPRPPRGGPRQRLLPTPRGVNMIVWSLDNRFVLAAIMGS